MASHLTQEREILYRMKRARKRFSEIAKALGRDRSTIYREVNRNSGGRGYRPQQAERMAKERRAACRRQAKLDNPEIKKYVTTRLQRKWSPEQIAGRIREDLPRKKRCHVSYQTIYTTGWRATLRSCVSIRGEGLAAPSRKRVGN